MLFDDRLKIMLYNPEVMPKDQLPKTYLDLADPRYKGKFTVPPWATSYSTGALVYGKERWIDVIAEIGQNASGVATYAQGAQQLLARQIAFQQDNLGDYFTQKSLGANVPVDYAWFQDFTGLNSQYYVVPRNAKHPAAATLFAMYMATDEGAPPLRPPTSPSTSRAGIRRWTTRFASRSRTPRRRWSTTSAPPGPRHGGLVPHARGRGLRRQADQGAEPPRLATCAAPVETACPRAREDRRGRGVAAAYQKG